MSDQSLEAAWLVLYGSLGTALLGGAFTLASSWIQVHSTTHAQKQKERLERLEKAFGLLEEIRIWSIGYGGHVMFNRPDPGPNPLPRLHALVSLHFERLDDAFVAFGDAQQEYCKWVHAYKPEISDSEFRAGLEIFLSAIHPMSKRLILEARRQDEIDISAQIDLDRLKFWSRNNGKPSS